MIEGQSMGIPVIWELWREQDIIVLFSLRSYLKSEA